jgi:hypothetical protein
VSIKRELPVPFGFHLSATGGLGPARFLARRARHDAYPRQSLSPDDPGQDLTLPSLDEKPDPARELLSAGSARSAPGRVRRLL